MSATDFLAAAAFLAIGSSIAAYRVDRGPLAGVCLWASTVFAIAALIASCGALAPA